MSDLETLRRLEALEKRLASLETIERGGGSTAATMTFAGSSTAGTWTYSVAVGYWTLIAGRVFIDISISTATRPVAPTGDARLLGLPYASSSDTNSHSSFAISLADQVTIGGTTVQLGARVPPGQSYIELVEIINGANVLLPATSLTATAFVRLSGNYRVG